MHFEEGIIEAPDMTGEVISFASGIYTEKQATRANFTTQDAMNTEVGKFSPVADKYDEVPYLYTFDVSMYEQNNPDPIGQASYQLALVGQDTYASDGTLQLKYDESGNNKPLYWPDNSKGYAFKATAGNSVLTFDSDGQCDQSDAEKFYENDFLLGYAFEPLWDSETDKSADDIDALNYRTSREWYAANQQLKSAENGGNSEYWKKIPLYLKHQRSWITIKLKAGKGVPRTLLTYNATNNGFSSTMYSYVDDNTQEFSPWRKQSTVHYESDNTDAETITLNAIVDPCNYLDHPDDPIIKFVLNHSNYTFNTNNDSSYGIMHAGQPQEPVNNYEDKNPGEEPKSENYGSDTEGRNQYTEALNQYQKDLAAYENAKAQYERDKAQYDQDIVRYNNAVSNLQVYNLTAGKHLTITATLSTERVVLITALLEDWEDVRMSSICDDYGLPGSPIEIGTKDQLVDFLTNKNKPGNIGILKNPIDLDEGEDWSPVNLKCMLNLAGQTLSSKGRIFNDLDENASLANGDILITGTSPMTAAVSSTNHGNIEQINVLVEEENRKIVYATKGGLVGTNYGTISTCVNDLQVKGTAGYIGGIAGESKHDPNNAALRPTIDLCTMNARVGAEGSGFSGGAGGIVGYAENVVSRCAFNYGMTFSQQNDTHYGNIVQATITAEETSEDAKWIVDAFGNSWPTTYTNTIGKRGNVNANEDAVYYAVIDCQAELKDLLESPYQSTDKYQIANDFDVDDTWDLGVGNDDTYTANSDAKKYNLNFELDGNDKTITLHGTRLFSHINGYFHDLTIVCAADMSTTPDGGKDMLSAFAYSVNKKNDADIATIKNIRVKTEEGVSIQASQPAGIVCMAYGGAKIVDCEVQVSLNVKFDEDYNDQQTPRYAGAIAACSMDATFSGCKVYAGTVIAQDPDLGSSESPFDRKVQFRGGIVGGVITLDQYPAKTTIEDCYSWYDYGELKEYYSPAGALIGSANYYNGTTKSQFGLEIGAGGNWWKDVCAPAGSHAKDDAALLKAIGQRNRVTPTPNPKF